jgi:hypothetical protein
MSKLSVFYLFFIIFLSSCGESTPKRQLGFFNNSDRVLNIVIEDEKYSYYDKFIDPQSTIYYYGDTGTFDFVVYEEDGAFLRQESDVQIRENPGTLENYLWFDLEGENPILVANLNSYYGGSSFVENMTKYQSLELVHKYIQHSSPPFEPDLYYQSEIVHPFESMPSEVDLGDNVYAIIPLDNGYEDLDELHSYIITYIEKYN